METNWDDITRRLDIVPASVNTEEATQGQDCGNKQRGRGRAIRKVPYVFEVPAMTYSLAVVNAPVEGCLLKQYNYTASHAFRLLNPRLNAPITSASQWPMACIKWRVNDALASAIIASMMNIEWSALTPTQKFLCIIVVIKSAAMSTIAFLTTAQKRMEKDEAPFGGGDTAIIKKDDTKL